MSKALAGVARTRIKAIGKQIGNLVTKIQALQSEATELQQLVDADGSKALAGVAKTRLKAIDKQIGNLVSKIEALQSEAAELQQIVDAYSSVTTEAPDTAEQFSAADAEELV